MNRKLFAPLKRAGEHLLYIQGAKDCSVGVKPKRRNAFYLKGYAEQYEVEQKLESVFYEI